MSYRVRGGSADHQFEACVGVQDEALDMALLYMRTHRDEPGEVTVWATYMVERRVLSLRWDLSGEMDL